MRKYGNSVVYKFCCDAFDYLPIGALIDDDYLCIHGGLSPTLKNIDVMRSIYRKKEIPLEG